MRDWIPTYGDLDLEPRTSSELPTTLSTALARSDSDRIGSSATSGGLASGIWLIGPSESLGTKGPARLGVGCGCSLH